MFNKVIFIGRLGKNAEVKTAQNNKEYVVFSLATSESWKNEKGDYENRTEWHRVYAWSNLSSFAKTLQKGQLITLEGKIKYREVSEEVEGVTVQAQHRRDPRNKYEAALESRSCGRSGRRCERGRRRSTNGTGDYLSNEEAEVASAPKIWGR